MLVIAGYLLALVIAWAVVTMYVAAGSLIGQWAMLSPIRALLAPVLAMIFLLSSRFAPTRVTRMASLGASAVETVLFVSVALIWFHPFRQHLP